MIDWGVVVYGVILFAVICVGGSISKRSEQ
jgi:hypothetical protein